MEILAGETSCYSLLAFISIKMEMSWMKTKIGKVRPDLPLYKKFIQMLILPNLTKLVGAAYSFIDYAVIMVNKMPEENGLQIIKEVKNGSFSFQVGNPVLLKSSLPVSR